MIGITLNWSNGSDRKAYRILIEWLIAPARHDGVMTRRMNGGGIIVSR